MHDVCREELMTRTFHSSLSCSGKPPVSSCWSIWSLPIFVLCDFCRDHPQNDDSSPPSTSPPLEISWRQQTRFLSTWLPAPRMTRNICIIKENTLFQDYRLWSLLTHFKERHYSSRVPQYTPNTQHTYTINYTVHAGLSASTWCSTWLVSGVPSLWDSLVSRSSMQCMWLIHRSICNLNIPPPSGAQPPGHLNVLIFGRQIPVSNFQKAVQMPHMQDPLDGQMPHPWGILFFHLTEQDCFKPICSKY